MSTGRAVGVAMAVAVSVAAGLLAPPARASTSGDGTAPPGAGDHLEVWSDQAPGTAIELVPGHTATWQVGVRAGAPVAAEVVLGLGATTDLAGWPADVVVGVDSCSQPWQGGTCASGARSELGAVPLRALAPRPEPIATMASGASRWLLVRVSIPADASSDLQGRRFGLRAGATADGAGPPPAPAPGEGAGAAPGALPRTGFALLAPAALAAVAVAAGVALSWLARTRAGRASSEVRPVPSGEVVR